MKDFAGICKSLGCYDATGEECDDCVIEGNDCRWVPAVNEYASTCDGCGELCHHELQEMDDVTQLGYCPACINSQNQIKEGNNSV